MRYENFIEKVREEILGYFPDEYKNAEVMINPVKKVNKTYDGLVIKKPGQGICPTLYLNDLYESYLKTGDFDSEIKKAAETYIDAVNKGGIYNSSILTDPEYIKENLFFQLINREQNKEMLKEIPYREYLDLAIIYRIKAANVNEGEGIASAILNNNILEIIGFSEKDLFSIASANTKKLFPPTIENIEDILMKRSAALPLDEVNIQNLDYAIPMFVLSNSCMVNGAASMLYEEGLKVIADALDSDLYILPSSVHEVIVISAKEGDPYYLAQMVADINATEVNLSERLSNQVYLYDRDLRKVSLATDTPNKRLDFISI